MSSAATWVLVVTFYASPPHYHNDIERVYPKTSAKVCAEARAEAKAMPGVKSAKCYTEQPK